MPVRPVGKCSYSYKELEYINSELRVEGNKYKASYGYYRDGNSIPKK